jgi:hypothetical protein
VNIVATQPSPSASVGSTADGTSSSTYGAAAGRPSTASCHARSSASIDGHSARPVRSSASGSSSLTPA